MVRSVGAGAAHVRPREGFARARRPGVPADCPELDCLRGRLPDSVLEQAQARAAQVGTGADRVLIAAGTTHEDEYVRALADWLALKFEPLVTDVPECTLGPAAMIARASLGLLPVVLGGTDEPSGPDDSETEPNLDIAVVVAPTALGARGLCRLFAKRPALARHFQLTTTERMRAYIARTAQTELTNHAAHALHADLSAAPPRRVHAWALVPTVLFFALAFATQATAAVSAWLLTAMFTAWLALRCASALLAAPAAGSIRRMPDEDLPTYTIVAALYREAASVDGLLRALARLDYPPEKLDVIFAIEADDVETRAAIERRTGRLPVSTIIVPPGGPRTKPKALNVVLPFARGNFIVIYDAEDRPEPDQLRRACDAFARGDARLACVQARLSIDNTDDGWLTRGIMAQTPQDIRTAKAT